MNIEVKVPDDWSPGLAFAVQQLMQRAVGTGWPLITCLREDVTPEQMQDIGQRIEALVRDAGLAA